MSEKEKGFIKICPACGFSFDTRDQNSRKKIVRCPMCGYEFSSPEIDPNKPNNFDKRII